MLSLRLWLVTLRNGGITFQNAIPQVFYQSRKVGMKKKRKNAILTDWGLHKRRLKTFTPWIMLLLRFSTTGNKKSWIHQNYSFWTQIHLFTTCSSSLYQHSLLIRNTFCFEVWYAQIYSKSNCVSKC